MTTLLHKGTAERSLLSWAMTRDEEGHREYKAKFLVEADTTDGPANVLQTAGLPVPGSAWQFGGDVDAWAFCRPNATVLPFQAKEGEPHKFWTVELTYSTRPLKRCGDEQVEDPLLEPQRLSFGFFKTKEEATTDRFGVAILNSAHEVLRGPQVEFDWGYPTVVIEQNVPLLQYELLAALKNTVNANTLWGFPPRTIRLADAAGEEKYHGLCQRYYTRKFTFEIRYSYRFTADGELVHDSWDRDVLDEGTKVLNGRWGSGSGETSGWIVERLSDGTIPDPDNPSHFIRLKDRNGENMRGVLDGHGRPVDVSGVTTGTNIFWTGTSSLADEESDDEPGTIHVEFYEEADFLLLGIPALIGP